MSENGSSTFDVEKVAELAHLDIDPDAKASLGAEMKAIVAYVEMLSELDTDGIEPTAHAFERVNVVREDEVHPPLGGEAMLANAPATIDGELVKVPQVLPGEGMA